MTINNEHNKLNVPNLRFKEFQGEWEKCKLSEICTFSLVAHQVLLTNISMEETLHLFVLGDYTLTTHDYL